MSQSISRRGLLRAGTAIGTAIGTVAGTGVLSGCAMGGGDDNEGAKSEANAQNPLGVKEDAPLEVVIFNGGFGEEYAKAHEAMYKERWPKAEIKHSATQQISQTLQPRDIYEAALLDGANRVTTLLRVTVPLLWDTIQVAWVYLAILAIDGFAVVQIITEGGPGFSSDVVGLRLYDTAFKDAQFGYASAIGVSMFFLTLTVAAMFLRVTRRDRVEL